MKTLCILSKAPDRQNESFLKRVMGPEDAIVCIQDGVYFARKKREDIPCPVYGLNADLTARGIETPYEIIDYPRLVDMTFAGARVVTI